MQVKKIPLPNLEIHNFNIMNPSFILKKGPADPFRGDWYLEEGRFKDKEEAIRLAAAKTFEEYQNLKTSWEAYGYEWSVFRKADGAEMKIWEGYKFIQEMIQKAPGRIDTALGNMGE